MLTEEKATKIAALQEEIASLEKNSKVEYEAKQKELAEYGYLTSFCGVHLYRDRIVGDNRTVMLDSNVQAAVESNGEISYTTEVKGGGTRPTLTRIAAGGLIAGPLGAVIGATAQKKKKSETVVHEHDTRVVRVMIASDDGYITTSGNGNLDNEAHDFVTCIMNATLDYPKIKKDIAERRASLEKELRQIEKDNPAADKKKELEKLMSGLSEAEKKVISNLEKDIDTAYWISLGGLFVCFFPIFGIICPAISFIKAMKIRKLGIKNGTANAAFIVSIIGLVISGVLTISILSSGNNNNTSTNDAIQQTESQQEEVSVGGKAEETSQALAHSDDELTASGVRYGDLVNYSDIQKILLRIGDAVSKDDMVSIVEEYPDFTIYTDNSNPNLDGYYIVKTDEVDQHSGKITCLSECINVSYYTYDGADGEQDLYYGTGLSSTGAGDNAKPLFSCSKGYSPIVTINHKDTKYNTWVEALAAYNSSR